MSLKNRVLNNIKERRERVLRGDINSIPSPFIRFREDFVGIEKGRYYMITSPTKVGKSQIASFLFLYTPILYSYYNKDKARVKVFYFPLEETKESVMERFMCYLLYSYTNGKIRIAPKDLRSTDNSKPLSEEILKVLESKEFNDIIDYFESCIVFPEGSNATGVWKECKQYAEEHGKVHTKKKIINDEFTGDPKEVDVFDYYEADDPDEYRIIFYDHISLIPSERGMDLRQSMGKLSEYFVTLRNRYNYSPVVIQQQAFFENTDAFKLDRLKPSIANLADNKATSRDINICLSLFSPYKYELQNHLGYDITKLKDNIRFLEVLINRDGSQNGVIALYFDGAVNYFREMPPAKNKEEIERIYKYLENIRKPKITLLSWVKTIVNKIKQ